MKLFHQGIDQLRNFDSYTSKLLGSAYKAGIELVIMNVVLRSVFNWAIDRTYPFFKQLTIYKKTSPNQLSDDMFPNRQAKLTEVKTKEHNSAFSNWLTKSIIWCSAQTLAIYGFAKLRKLPLSPLAITLVSIATLISQILIQNSIAKKSYDDQTYKVDF